MVDTQQQASPAALRPYWAQRPHWTQAGPDGLERAVIEVPADYAQPGGRRLDIAVSRLRGTDPARRRGILLALNGGPGGVDGLGREFPLTLRERSPLNEVYDLIGFDPRGWGGSTPLNAYVAPTQAPFDSRPPDDRFSVIAEDMRVREEACQRGGGDLRPHVTSRNTARDLDIIRAALGEEKISFIGYAYGSVVGAAYGTMFPEHLDRSLLDSCVHPDWTWGELFLRQADAIRANVDSWAQWAAERDGEFGLGRTAAAVLAAVEGVAAWFGAGPDEVRLRTLFDGAIGSETAARRDQWAQLCGLVGEVRAAQAGRDDEHVAKLLAGTATWRPEDHVGELRCGVLDAVTLETDWPADLAGYYANMRRVRDSCPYGYGVLRAQPWVGTFRSYEPPEPPVRAVRDGYPAGLVVHADGDPLDHYDGGVAMARRLGHRLVTVADSGDHAVYVLGGVPAADEIGHRYFMDGVLPDGDVTVASVPRPPVPADRPPVG